VLVIAVLAATAVVAGEVAGTTFVNSFASEQVPGPEPVLLSSPEYVATQRYVPVEPGTNDPEVTVPFPETEGADVNDGAAAQVGSAGP
jgi:hypothetical protein